MAINKKTVFDKFDLKNISETIEPKIFYERIYDSLVYYISAKFKVNFAANPDKLTVFELLNKTGITIEKTEKFSKLIDKIFFVRFGRNCTIEFHEMEQDLKTLEFLYETFDNIAGLKK